MNDATTLIEVDGLDLRFSGQRDLAFRFGAGVVALTGRNGIGKSTLLSVLGGVHPAEQGRILVAGHDLAKAPRQARALLAYVPDESVAYDFMTGDEFLRMVQALRGQREAPALPALLNGFGLGPHLDKRFGAMSLGTRKKFMLASALASDARVILMDEPTNGIDVQARGFLLETFIRDRDRKLFFFSTHDLDAVARCGAQVFALPGPGMEAGARAA